VWRVSGYSEYKILITFACAVALERNREVGAWLREAGHEPLPGWRWEEMWRLLREEEAEHIRPDRSDQGDVRRTSARLVLPLWTLGQHAS
jgi:hypothetical protein